MEIIGFKTNEAMSKITSYSIKLNNKIIMLDYGAKIKNKEFIKSIDIIFLSHEHFDHTYGLFENIFDLKDDCKIYSTKTTKLVLKGLIAKNFEMGDKRSECMKRIDNINELIYEKEYDIDGIKVEIFQSGHTYGSAMIYLKGEYSLFYTGDINYYSAYKCQQYFIPHKIDTDYLIVDGTNILKDDYKKVSLTHVKKNATNIKRFTVNARYEKSILIGLYLACEFKDKNIYFGKDLLWYLNILFSQGYDPTINHRINVDYEDKYKSLDGIYISSEDFKDHNKDYNIGLHISNDDYHEFFNHFNAKKIIYGHFDINDYDEIKNIYDGHYVMKEGVNIIE